MEIDSDDYDVTLRAALRVIENESYGSPKNQSPVNLSHLVRGYPMQNWGHLKNDIQPLAEVSGEIKVNIEWGGSQGTQINVGGAVSASDNRGDYVEVSGSQNVNSGEGNVEITAGTEIKGEK